MTFNIGELPGSLASIGMSKKKKMQFKTLFCFCAKCFRGEYSIVEHHVTICHIIIQDKRVKLQLQRRLVVKMQVKVENNSLTPTVCQQLADSQKIYLEGTFTDSQPSVRKPLVTCHLK